MIFGVSFSRSPQFSCYNCVNCLSTIWSTVAAGLLHTVILELDSNLHLRWLPWLLDPMYSSFFIYSLFAASASEKAHPEYIFLFILCTTENIFSYLHTWLTFTWNRNLWEYWRPLVLQLRSRLPSILVASSLCATIFDGQFLSHSLQGLLIILDVLTS